MALLRVPTPCRCRCRCERSRAVALLAEEGNKKALAAKADATCWVEIPARTSDESRFLVVACLHGRHWTAVITYRLQVIRLISVRRSRPEEVQLYEQL